MNEDLDHHYIEQQVKLLKAFTISGGYAVGMALLKRRADGGCLSLTDVAERAGLSQSETSRVIKHLKQRGVAECEKTGMTTCCNLIGGRVREALTNALRDLAPGFSD